MGVFVPWREPLIGGSILLGGRVYIRGGPGERWSCQEVLGLSRRHQGTIQHILMFLPIHYDVIKARPVSSARISSKVNAPLMHHAQASASAAKWSGSDP